MEFSPLEKYEDSSFRLQKQLFLLTFGNSDEDSLTVSPESKDEAAAVLSGPLKETLGQEINVIRSGLTPAFIGALVAIFAAGIFHDVLPPIAYEAVGKGLPGVIGVFQVGKMCGMFYRLASATKFFKKHARSKEGTVIPVPGLSELQLQLVEHQMVLNKIEDKQIDEEYAAYRGRGFLRDESVGRAIVDKRQKNRESLRELQKRQAELQERLNGKRFTTPPDGRETPGGKDSRGANPPSDRNGGNPGK